MTNLTHELNMNNSSLFRAHDQWCEYPNGVKSTSLVGSGEILRRTSTYNFL